MGIDPLNAGPATYPLTPGYAAGEIIRTVDVPMKKEFAPVTPGEMLKEQLLSEYGLSQNQLAKAIAISPNRITEIVNNPAPDIGGHRATFEALLRQQRGVLDEPPGPL